MTARYLLDSDICIYRLSGRNPAVAARFDRLRPGEAAISAIAYGELLLGVAGSNAPAVAAARLQALATIAPVALLPLGASAHYANIRRQLESAGTPIGSNDVWIAAHASAAGLILVTNNQREFRRVPGLELENWAAVDVREAPRRYGRGPKAKAAEYMGETVYMDPIADLRAILSS
jgi:tRNA(fMet)-specific endonuclease VapC